MKLTAKEKPILFCGEMVRAILEGRKNQTRRVVKPDIAQAIESNYSKDDLLNPLIFTIETDNGRKGLMDFCPYNVSTLWVRETWSPIDCGCKTACTHRKCLYRATSIYAKELEIKWKPSIFMTRKYSRINLTVKNIRVERLQKITEEDAIAEGCTHTGLGINISADEIETAKEQYQRLWESINGKDSWNSNSYVWVIEFERLK